MKETAAEKFIRPYRIIPFDIGGSISRQEVENIINHINQNHPDDKMEVQIIDNFQQSLSDRLIGGYIVSKKILLFLGSSVVSVGKKTLSF